MSENDSKNREPDPEISRLLLSLVQKAEMEDRPTRERQLRTYRKLKLYWSNLSRIYWSATARDYRIASNIDTTNADIQQAYYDRPVNIFKAFLETIIAALSVSIPSVNCIPDDAENPLDTATAKAGNIASEQIDRHNNAILVWLQALYTWYTEGIVGCYQYVKESEEYGTYEKQDFKEEEIDAYVCPSCQAQLSDEAFSNSIEDMYAPDNEDVMLLDTINSMGPVCPDCGELLDENLQKQKTVIQRVVGVTTKPKARICLEVFGGLYIKIANYAKKQADTPYLTLTYDTHYSNALEMYPFLRGKISKENGNVGGVGGNDAYDRVLRQNVEYGGELSEGTITIKYAWLRPGYFNSLSEAECKKLKAKFPSGAMVCFVNEQCAEFCNESLDDVWTLTKNPLSDYLVHEPNAEALVNFQDIINDLVSLTLQTIEHGVVQTWADPSVVNFNGQSQLEANPGMLTAVKAQGGKNISDAFYTSSAATLAPEVLKFYEVMQNLGQFVSGAMPSIFGGTQGKNSSGTASEYAMQKAMALQRLQSPWKMLTIWWKEVKGKSIPAYMKEIQADERIVRRDPNNSTNYINVFIRRAELGGKIGDYELENAENLPVTDEQKADIVMRLMELNNEEVMQSLILPENLPFIRKVVKMPEFKLAGESDREKQYEEISKLLGGEMVEIEPMIDNNVIHAEICKSWAVGIQGRYAKEMNPVGYMMVLEHFAAHQAIVDQQMAAQAAAMAGPENQNSSEGANKLPKGKSEIKGESDVRTPVQ